MNKNIYSVSQINNYIKLLFESDVLLNDIYIEGEVSNFRRNISGHLYFSIKDQNSIINCIIYKSNTFNINFGIKDGIMITAFGYISSYTKTGQYQFYIEEIFPLGEGTLQQNFELLKEKLFKQGLFDENLKKQIPKYPKNIGVVTSPTGAAIRDIINIYKRRNPTINLVVIPSLVQGKDATYDIIKAIEMAIEYSDLDILILARGGGTSEDLDCFNNEELAKAIYHCPIPIITGIGHEIDFTIADFVADFRAPTPSAAIEIALPESDILKERLFQNYYKINNIIKQKIDTNRTLLKLNLQKSLFKNFLNLIMDYQASVDNNLNSIIKGFNYKLKEKKVLFANILNMLNAISPTNILKNGYSYISDENGHAIKSVKSLNSGDIINIKFYDGEKKAKIF